MDLTSFYRFCTAKEQRLEIIIVLVTALLSATVLSILYPFPDTMADSHGYIDAAAVDTYQIYRPFGYSLFLQALNNISTRISSVFIAQHVIHTLSILWFILSIGFFWRKDHSNSNSSKKAGNINKTAYYLFVLFTAFTPVYWYLSNSIMSDSIFASMSILWITCLLWAIKGYRPLIFTAAQALLLFAMLHTRHIAMFYPILSIPIYIYVFKKRSLLPVLFTIAAIFIFRAQTINNTAQLTNIKRFSSGFEGWQLANNALHIVPHINTKPSRMPTGELQYIHTLVMHSKDTISLITEGNNITSAFMWNNKLPLKSYMLYNMQVNKTPYLIEWMRLGPVYSKYGSTLIKKHPYLFTKHYLLPNTWNALWVQPGIISEFENHPPLKQINIWFSDSIEQGDYKAKSTVYETYSKILPALSLAGWILLFALGVRALYRRIRNAPCNRNTPCKRSIYGILYSISSEPYTVFLFIFGLSYIAAIIWASPIEARYFMPIVPVKAFFMYRWLLNVCQR